MQGNEYRRTDLAVENGAVSQRTKGVACREETMGRITVTTVEVENEEGEKAIGRPIGHYITLSFPAFWEETEKVVEKALTSLLSEYLTSLLIENKAARLLVVGLGNRAFTADAIGPFTAERITVTGHLEEEEAGACRLYAFSPGVAGTTGMEALALIKGAVEACKASQVIVIDALASMSEARLGKTVQLADTGIVPGSGVGNHRAALNRETLGVPVIAVGVPLIVSSSTLVLSALEKAGIETLDEGLVKILENGRSFFVTPKDCDLIVTLLADVIADAITESVERIAHGTA